MLILASASPRRHKLLRAAGIDHVVQPTSIPEERRQGEEPLAFVQRLAEEKARAAQRGPSDIVLGADTVVCVDDHLLCKPTDEADACRMLQLLAGREHFVHTGICLLHSDERILDVATTAVTFAQLTAAEVTEYTRSGEPFDKAGAYAIQGLASRFVLSINGSYENVVGLPVALVYRHLKAWSGT